MERNQYRGATFHELGALLTSSSVVVVEDEGASAGPIHRPLIKRFESHPDFRQSASMDSSAAFDRSVSNSESSTGLTGPADLDGLQQFRAPSRISVSSKHLPSETVPGSRRGVYESIRSMDVEEPSSAEDIAASMPGSSSMADHHRGVVNGSEISGDDVADPELMEADDFPLDESFDPPQGNHHLPLPSGDVARREADIPTYVGPPGGSLPLTLLTEFLAHHDPSVEAQPPIPDVTHRPAQPSDGPTAAPEHLPTAEEVLEYSRNRRSGLSTMKIDEKLMQKIDHSLKFQDEVYEYRYVVLPRTHPFFNLDPSASPRNRLLSEKEWRSLGIRQTRGWDHYSYSEYESNVLLFRRPLETDPQTGFSSEDSRRRVEERLAFIDETRKKLRST